jgi:uncharacterized metal-binding protein (TIGR02443 family)
MMAVPMRRGDACPTCSETDKLRWGLEHDGVYVYCQWCGYDSRRILNREGS